MASVRGIIVEIGGDTSKLQEALKKVNSSTASLSKELKGINSLLKLDPKNTELVSQKQTVLKNNIEETSKKLEELRTAQQMADETIKNGGEISEKEYRNLQREIINTENKLKKLKLEASKWTQAGRSIEEFGNKVTNISNKVDKMGTTITTRLTLPIVGIATGLVNASKEFETAFTGVEKTVDGTAEQMAQLKQGIKDMSEELPSSTTEISAVAEAAGQLGIKTEDILSFTKVMINLGNSTNLSAEEAASSLAKFANVTKMSAQDYDKLGAVIVALGNNFATTESDIVSMATRLASTGELTGLSQSQIMALATAMSSVGIEAEAGGSAMSKLLKQIQVAVETGNADLKRFAKVAGMSTKEFKKAFEQDAMKGLSAFIGGLNDTERNGKSAIAILEDMGLTEVRLSNTVLSLANASDVMNNAVDLANKSWDENTALTNEASKRYQTLDSRMEMTKNKVKNLATNTGDKLTPTFNKLLDKVDKTIDKFDDLNEEETENIIKTLAVVAAIGPAIKIVGTLGSTAGKTITNIGKLSKSIGEIRAGAETTTISMKSLKLAVVALSNPAGQATLAITALCAAYIAYRNIVEAETRKVISEANEQNKAWQELQTTRNNMLSDSMAEIGYYQKLKEELQSITDENGKVKEGYEKRADVILNTLNQALGTEYNLNESIIGSYQNLQNEIDTLIQKKKAEATLNAYQQEYATAMKEQETAVKTLIELQERQEDAANRMHSSTGIAAANAKKEYEQLGIKIGEQANLVTQYGETIADYDNLQAAVATGSAEEIEKALQDITTSYQNMSSDIDKSVSEQVSSQAASLEILKTNLSKAKESNNQYLADILQSQVDMYNKQLKELENSLLEQTQTVEKLTPEQKEAWKNIAQQDYNGYIEMLSKLSDGTKQQIENATGVVSINTSLPDATSWLGGEAAAKFGGGFGIAGIGTNKIQDLSNTIKIDDSVSNATAILASNAESGFNDNVDGEKWGNDFVNNLVSGLWNATTIGKITNAVSSIAGVIHEYMHHTTPDKGPLKNDDEWMPDFIDNMASGIINNKSKVTNATAKMGQEMRNTLNIPLAQDFGKFQGSISNQIVDSTKTVFTTPQIVFNVQELDETKLEQCFNYVNRKFGSKY